MTRVLDATHADDTSTTTLTLKKSKIEDEFQTATLEFGQPNDIHVVHRHNQLARRRPQAEIVGTSSAIGRPTGMGTPTASIVAQTMDTVNRTDLEFSEISSTFDGTFGRPNPFEFCCANCTAHG